MITNCNNCAGPLNLHKDNCEYCGTYYKQPKVVDNTNYGPSLPLFPLLENYGILLKDPTKMINFKYSYD